MKIRFVEILMVVVILLALALVVGCKDKAEATEPNVVVLEIDPNSELVRNLNLVYDPNFYSTKIICLQFDFSEVKSANKVALALRELYAGNAKGVIDIEVRINNETHTASFEDFFEWMGFKR